MAEKNQNVSDEQFLTFTGKLRVKDKSIQNLATTAK
jgi:hypothetical protein